MLLLWSLCLSLGWIIWRRWLALSWRDTLQCLWVMTCDMWLPSGRWFVLLVCLVITTNWSIIPTDVAWEGPDEARRNETGRDTASEMTRLASWVWNDNKWRTPRRSRHQIYNRLLCDWHQRRLLFSITTLTPNRSHLKSDTNQIKKNNTHLLANSFCLLAIIQL